MRDALSRTGGLDMTGQKGHRGEMNILVSGNRGYIGSVLIPHLEKLGHNVTSLLGVVEAHRTWFDAPMKQDAVIHLAAFNDLYGCESHPLKSWYTNYWGAILAMKYCVENKARLIFPSTDTVIGLDGSGPISVYDSHKWSAEKSIMSTPKRELEAVVLRFSTVYGPSPASSPQKNRGIINMWCKMALSGEALRVYQGVADCKRDLVHIDDVVGAFDVALASPPNVYHVCTGIGTTLIDIANTIDDYADGVGINVIPDPEGLHPIEYRTWIGDPHYLTWMTGWTPKTHVVDGLRETVKYFEQQREVGATVREVGQ